MVASSRIVVGVDGSASARDAVRWATREAIRRGAPLELATSTLFEPGNYSDAIGLRIGAFTDPDVDAKRVLTEAVDLVHETAGVHRISLDTSLHHGSAADVLSHLSPLPAMIVLGSRGLGEFTGGLMGSVGSAVLAHAKCPVAVIKNGGVADGPIVVGVDCTAGSQPAIGFAMREASLRGADLVAVHAWSDLELGSVLTRDDDGPWANSDFAERTSLAESLAGWSVDYPDVVIRRVVVQDRPVRELLHASEMAQMVVVGSRGRGGFASLLLGSTARAVVHSVDVPVVVVPTER
ncbi:universal stress protein [Rhodococcus sp. MALMAid1271]|uniref:universal stress protein n=1 Tax=Rhodococcus sp. MALMAid1271 TaxID=3411744 RepID=UPI003B9FDDA4